MTSPHPPDHSRPGEGRHHHDHWLGRLYRLNLIHQGYHLPFSKIFLSLLFVGSAIVAILLMAALFVHWKDRRDDAVANGRSEVAIAAADMNSQLAEVIAVTEHLVLTDITQGRFEPQGIKVATDEDGDRVYDEDKDGHPDFFEGSLEARLRQFLEDNSGFWGVGACFEGSELLDDFAELTRDWIRFEGKTPHLTGENYYCPYFTRPGGIVTFTPVNYNYTDPCLIPLARPESAESGTRRPSTPVRCGTHLTLARPVRRWLQSTSHRSLILRPLLTPTTIIERIQPSKGTSRS